MVEVRDRKPVRIFNGKIDWQNLPEGAEVRPYYYVDAVHEIREQVRLRANNECERCGTPLTATTGEMHERLPRGMGGEISLDNGWWLCYRCHQGRPDSEHGNRRPHWSG